MGKSHASQYANFGSLQAGIACLPAIAAVRTAASRPDAGNPRASIAADSDHFPFPNLTISNRILAYEKIVKGSRSSKRKIQFSAFTILDCLYESRPICNLTAMSQRLWDNLSCKIVSSPRFVIWGAFPASLLLLFNFYFLIPGSLLLLALGKFLDQLFVL